MKLIGFFVHRPVGTTLLALALLLGGLLGYRLLPVADLPNIEFPVIMVTATQPGGSPSEIASTVAGPLERHLGAIAGIREITSHSTATQAHILLQFELSRDVNGAARDVQAALRAARQDLPTSLRQDPKYKKANSNGPPILILTLQSMTRTPQQLYDFANNIIMTGLSQVQGVGNVVIGGSALPAVRVEINPLRLFHYGIGFEDIRAALASANAHTPKGFITLEGRRFTIATNDQISGAKAYHGLIIAYRNNQPVRLSDVADIIDSSEDIRQAGYADGKPAIICAVFAESGANIIKTIDQIKRRLPMINASLPGDSSLVIRLDRSNAIRAALTDTEKTLLLSVLLVVLVVFVFLHDIRTTLIPAIIVPLATIGTFGVMYLAGYQLDTLSLMALTIATGFIVDDAIVVLENITRYREKGLTPHHASIVGAGEVAFTVISITLSLIVVFLPILLMSGLTGLFFHEFAMTMIIALTLSLLLSLSLTPMMCAYLLTDRAATDSFYPVLITIYFRKIQYFLILEFDKLLALYKSSLTKALLYPRLVALSLPVTVMTAIILFLALPKELFPQEDQGLIMGRLVADQSISFQALSSMTNQVQRALRQDPDIASVVTRVGRDTANSADFFISLRPRQNRRDTIDTTINRLNRHFSHYAGANLRLHLPPAIGGGARAADGAYQYSLQGSSAEDLYEWTPKIVKALSHLPMLTDITTDVENSRSATVFLNRDVEARYKITPQLVSQTLYDAFGQRTASIIYGDLNQYHIVMEAAPHFLVSPAFLNQMWVSISGGSAHGGTVSNNLRVRSTTQTSSVLTQSDLSYQNAMANALAGGKSASNGSAVTTMRETMVPLPLLGKVETVSTPLAVNHQGQFVSTTISFNLTPGTTIGPAIESIQKALVSLHIPRSIQGNFAGNLAQFKKTVNQEPILIAGALAAIYVVLGILYESLIHPLTILSTLPSAGVGALITVFLCGQAFSLLTLIGIILLIGIVKKNAIMLVDFALQEKKKGTNPYDAILKASLLRFRPILMTSLAAALGAVPLLIGHGYGTEMRYPLGLSILGGLCFSQLLTLYTTPVIYLYLERFSIFATILRQRIFKQITTHRSLP